jgi:two-component system chemotaxis sensor kinase CheA
MDRDSDSDAFLVELRAVFRDELDDQLATLEREVVVLARTDASPETMRAAVREIYRAVHSLKGAARAVDFPAIERTCHALENTLAPVRVLSSHDDTPLDVEAIRVATERTMQSLRAWVSEHLPRARPEPMPGEAAPPTAPAAHAPPRAPAAHLSPLVPATQAPAPAQPPPAPALPAQPAPAQPPAQPPAGPGLAAEPAPGSETVRVSAERVGRLLDQGEELVALTVRGARAQGGFAVFDDTLAELRRQLDAIRRMTRTMPELASAVGSAQAAVQTLSVWSLEQRRQQHLAWDEAMARSAALAQDTRLLRLVRVGTLRPALERAVLETARGLGKTVSFALEGEHVELDRRVIERLRAPLVQLLRNAVDHGIEPPAERLRAGKPADGRIEVHARTAGAEAVLRVRDDGRGFDFARVRVLARASGVPVPEDAGDQALFELALQPGFSTRAEASIISGRGMGLDIVRQRVAEMQGSLTLDSPPGAGAAIEIRVPVDLGVMRGLLVEARGARFLLVQSAVERVVRVRPEDERTLEGRRHLFHEGAMIPLADLGTALRLGGRSRASADTARPCVILASAERRIAYTVDALGDLRDIIIRPLGPRVRRSGLITGAAVVGDGEIACVLDAAVLARSGRAEEGAPVSVQSARRAATVLVVDDSVTTRQLLRSILETGGYDCEIAEDGEAAWHRLTAGEAIDLIVSDIEMPRLDGFQLLSRVRSSPKTAQLPFVLVTALSDDADRRRALELGADAYVVKDRFDQEALLDTVKELLP